MQQCFAYSKQAESALAKLMGISATLAEGNHSEFDFTDNRTSKTYEVKFQFAHSITLEVAQSKTGVPSGVSVSTADYWVIVSKGFSDGVVGKVRKFNLADLKSVCSTDQLDKLGESKRIIVDPRDVPHEWLGDVTIDEAARTWDLHTWARRAPTKVSFKRKPTIKPDVLLTDNDTN